MDTLVDLWEKPTAREIFMIAGWRQWADAGAISSALPKYLAERAGARKIGEIGLDGFYLFQVPGTHGLVRPTIKLEEGYRKELQRKQNEFFYSGNDDKGLLIFLGDEPHQNVERYAEALLDVVAELGVKRVAAIGGVYGEMPYDKDREISCVYSLPGMHDELDAYAVQFSNYEGGSTIGTYLVDRAEDRGIEFLVLYAFVPAYNFTELSVRVTGIQVEKDYKAWYDVSRRLNHMFGLDMDLSDLEKRSEKLLASIDAKIEELEQTIPELKAREYVDRLSEGFVERPFMPDADVWERELRDLFDDSED